ncbi:glycosyltransferase 87 family protein [Dactylosporangium sp. CA-152071]|uniref:glycosyltransferase family 87 protein n=1 Tax=Dactylosporangium sp. CA-152071 TaxID=3239933 RepID=UPI003D917AD8
MRRLVPLILGGAVALQLAAGFAPPRSSDDLYRYVWDGRIQVAGIDPYRYPPAAPELREHRDPDFLWAPDGRWCAADGCTLINRPAVPTIYPPVAEAYFTVVHVLSPRDGRTGPMQFGAALFALATTALLLWGGHGRSVALWAWCPTVAVEAANNAHVDVLAAFLTALAILLVARRRVWVGGAALGLAIATKVTPLLVAPALARRRPLAVAVAAVGAVLAVYAPHVAVVGPKVLGYLPGYLREEGYAGGRRFALLTLLVPGHWAAPVAAVILALVAVWAARAADPDRPWSAAAVVVGAALLVSAPGYPWYSLLLVLLAAAGGRAEWLGVAVAGSLVLYAADIGLDTLLAQRLGYGAALAVVVAVAAWRRRTSAGAGLTSRPRSRP